MKYRPNKSERRWVTQPIKCPHCGKEFELSDAITKDLQATVLDEEQRKHRHEIAELTERLESESRQEIARAKQKSAEQARENLVVELQELRDESTEDKENMKLNRADCPGGEIISTTAYSSGCNCR
jgi:hypothetical protein